MVIKKDKNQRFINDDIVISGVSGRFPDSSNVIEFQDKLIKGVDMVKEDDSRWPKGYLGTYTTMGLVKDLRKFDASFFGAPPKLAERTDPIVRVLLQTSFEAILDAGISPIELRGSETGVVVGVSSNEAADWWSADPDLVNGYEFLGCTRTMYSNRISFVFDLKGPSYTMDCQSASSLAGIQQGYYMLKNGMVDAVIVAAVNLVLNPHFNIMFQKLNMLAPDGKYKIFDAAADGYARSEAGVALIMQRKSDARRVYATVAGIGTNCDGFKPDGCHSYSLQSQTDLYKEVYEHFNIDPLQVTYVEAHGYGTKDGDAIEVNGIEKFFCRGRTEPLQIGCVKSNMGHSEPAGGLVALVKVLLALEENVLVPNLHYHTPNPNIPALKDGRISVCDKLTVWNGGLIAINSFGIGGTNSHLVLKRNNKEKNSSQEISIPRLICVSGRTEQGAKSFLNKVKKYWKDNEFCGLLSKIFSRNITYYDYRAFSVILGSEEITEITPYDGPKNSICFVFAGMGSQWQGMGKDLLELEPFRRSTDKCAKALQKEKFDLYRILLSEDKSIFQNPLNSFVGITSIQIALVDVLRELGIIPNYLVGHSIGELACAYADDTLTLEQTVLVAYWRGKSLLTSNIPAGSMAAIGLSAEEVSKRIPQDIYVACHNSSDSATISGPPHSISKFTELLQSEAIFAREVNSSGVAFHSPYVAAAGPQFKKTLEKIITEPKLRTQRWISTSFPESKWNTQSALYSSVDYHLNNLLSPVLFQEALTKIPENTVIIEVAPHALLQPILRNSLPTCTNIGLLRRNQATVSDFLANIGRLYNAGLYPQVENLYPSVTFPVGRKTPMLQSLVEWDHSKDWFLVSFLLKRAGVQGEVEKEIDVSLDRYRFLLDSTVDDLPTLPVSAYLVYIWEAVAKFQYKQINEVSLVIENFQIIKKSILDEEVPLKFEINILENSNECEIRESGNLVARALVKIPSHVDGELLPNKVYSDSISTDYLPLKSTDVYQDLSLKGYTYKELFRGIKYVDNRGESSRLAWNDNWITFIDTMMQLHILNIGKQRHYAVNHIQKIVIDPKRHSEILNTDGHGTDLHAVANHKLNAIKSGGIELRGIQSSLVSLRTKQPPVKLYHWTFVPHTSTKVVKVEHAVNVAIQLICENSYVDGPLEVAEILRDQKCSQKTSLVSKLINDQHNIAQATYTIYYRENSPTEIKQITNETIKYVEKNISSYPTNEVYHLLITENALTTDNKNVLESLINSLKAGGFILTNDSTNISEEEIDGFGLKLITKYVTDHGTQLLLRKPLMWRTPMVVSIRTDSFNWIESVKMAIKKHQIDNRETIVIFRGEHTVGTIGLLKSIRKEIPKNGLRCVLTDETIEPYKIVNLKYIDYFRKGLVFNVYKNNSWGSYVHLPVQDEEQILEAEHAFIGLTEIGNLSTFSYVEGRIPYINTNDYLNHEFCYVYYSSIYAHDIRCVTGSLPYDDHTNVLKQGSVLGHEYSGRDSKGHRVFGMVGGGALATTVLGDKDVLWNVPDNWTLEEASTVPRVYSVAYYALVIRGKVMPGETVYINAGVSGLCIACVTVAQSVNAEVYIGYNNAAEKNYLQQTFPKMAEKYFISLEETNFVKQLLLQTNGEGVNIIFDTLNSHKRNSFIGALAVNGRLIEFEKSTTFNESLGFGATNKNITFHKISHHTLWVSESGRKYRKLIHKLVQEGVQCGVVKPIAPTTIFTDKQIEEAFGLLKSGNYKGKIIIKFRDEEDQKQVIPATKIVRAIPSFFMDSEKSYIVTGGLTAVGIQIVNWLIGKGADKIVISSPYKPVSGYQSLMLRRWKEQNVTVTISGAVTSPHEAENLVLKAENLAPLCGIFHAAYVDCHTPFMNSTVNHFQLPWNAKVEAARYLNEACKKLCPSLKYFIAFSHASGTYGAKEFSNVAYACSALNELFTKLRKEGFLATVIQLGPTNQEGTGGQSDVEGFISQKFSSYFDVIPAAVQASSSGVITAVSIDNKQTPTKNKADLIVKDICRVLAIRDSKNVSFKSFQELGVEPVSLNEIVKIFAKYEVKVSEESIAAISFNDIKSICQR